MGNHCNWCGKEFHYNPIRTRGQIGQACIALHSCSENCYAEGKLAFELESAGLSEEEALQRLFEVYWRRDTGI